MPTDTNLRHQVAYLRAERDHALREKETVQAEFEAYKKSDRLQQYFRDNKRKNNEHNRNLYKQTLKFPDTLSQDKKKSKDAESKADDSGGRKEEKREGGGEATEGEKLGTRRMKFELRKRSRPKNDDHVEEDDDDSWSDRDASEYYSDDYRKLKQLYDKHICLTAMNNLRRRIMYLEEEFKKGEELLDSLEINEGY